MSRCQLPAGIQLPIPPQHSIPLGDDTFCVVSKFQGSVYVQIRVYGKNLIKYYPTGKGVSFKKTEFAEFIENAESHKAAAISADESKLLFLNNTIAVSLLWGEENGNQITFLKGSEMAKCISLSTDQFVRLCDGAGDIKQYIQYHEDI